MGEFRKFQPVDVEGVHERGLKKVADLEKQVGWEGRIQEIRKNLTSLKSRSGIKPEKINALTDILDESQEQTLENEKKVKALEEEVQKLLENTKDPIQEELDALKVKAVKDKVDIRTLELDESRLDEIDEDNLNFGKEE